jgi:hypothetical protein
MHTGLDLLHLGAHVLLLDFAGDFRFDGALQRRAFLADHLVKDEAGCFLGQLADLSRLQSEQLVGQ